MDNLKGCTRITFYGMGMGKVWNGMMTSTGEDQSIVGRCDTHSI